jgi:integrase
MLLLTTNGTSSMGAFVPDETVYSTFTDEAFTVISCVDRVVMVRDGEGETHRLFAAELTRDTPARALAILPVMADQRSVPASMTSELAVAIGYASAEKSAATRRAYKTDFRLFRTWCEDKGASALPALPETVAAYLAYGVAQGAKASTLGRRVAAIRYAHRLGSYPVPTDDERVKATLRGIRRTIGAAKVKKTPAVADRIKAMVRGCLDTLAGKRDRALILLGFAGAFRRSELVALDVEHLKECEEGLRVHIARSKTDQDGEGVTIAIARGSSEA